MQDIVSRVADAVVHRHRRRAGLRAARPLERRRRVRHLPLSDSSAERARLLLLARSRHRHDHAALGVVRHQVAGRDDRRAADQVPDLVRAAALLRSDRSDRSRKERFYPGGGTVDREARHRRPRAVSHRSRAQRHPPARARRRHVLDALPQPASSSSRWPRWCTSISTRVPIRRCTIFCATTSRRSNRASTAWSARASGRFRRIRSASSSRCRSSRRARSTWSASRSSRCALGSSRRRYHRRRSAHPPVPARTVAPAGPQGTVPGRVSGRPSVEPALIRAAAALRYAARTK